MVAELMKGLSITLSHFFKKPVTLKYPDVKMPMYPRFRGRYIRMPLGIIKSFEWLFGLLPYSIRSRIGRKPIIQNMLQVSLRATK